MCVCAYTHIYRESAFWDLSSSVTLSCFYLNDRAPPSTCLYLAQFWLHCQLLLSGLLYWKAALAAAFPALTETRLIRPSSRAQAFIHYYSRGCVLVAQSYLTLCDPMGCSPPGSSFHGILQTRILGWAVTFLLQGIFRTQRLNLHLLCLLHCR